MRAARYIEERAKPCLFHSKALGVSVMVHGDDSVAVGPDQHLVATRKTLEDKYRLKVEVLGRGEGKNAERRTVS